MYNENYSVRELQNVTGLLETRASPRNFCVLCPELLEDAVMNVVLLLCTVDQNTHF